MAFFENRGQFKLCGQDVKDFLIIGNSHDTSSKLFVGTSNYMYRCENQFSSKIRNIEWKHTKVFDIDFLNIHDIIHSYEDGRRELYEKMARLKFSKSAQQRCVSSHRLLSRNAALFECFCAQQYQQAQTH